jgi:hypothetical protein
MQPTGRPACRPASTEQYQYDRLDQDESVLDATQHGTTLPPEDDDYVDGQRRGTCRKPGHWSDVSFSGACLCGMPSITVVVCQRTHALLTFDSQTVVTLSHSILSYQ